MGWENCWLSGSLGADQGRVIPFLYQFLLGSFPGLADPHPHLLPPFPCLGDICIGDICIQSISRLSSPLFHLSTPLPVFPSHFSISIRATSSLPSVFSYSFILDMIAFCFSKIEALEVSYQGQTCSHMGFQRTGNAFGMISLKENLNAFEIGELRYLTANQTQAVELGPQTVHKTSIRINSCCCSIFSAYSSSCWSFQGDWSTESDRRGKSHFVIRSYREVVNIWQNYT